MSHYRCSLLSVRESPARRSRVINLLVTEQFPADGVTHTDPVIAIGENFAAAPYYAGIAPAADKLGREIILLDQRGVGHSQPSLACPEVDALSSRTLDSATGDVAVRKAFGDAVRACHDRLTAAGVDLAAYNTRNAAGDVAALAQAMHLPSWNVGAWGTSSRIAFQLLQQAHPGLRAAFLDSPELPGDDPRTTAIADTSGALSRLFADCHRAVTCRSPALRGLPGLASVLTALERRPVTLAVKSASSTTTVRFDAAMTLRTIRMMMTQNGAGCCPEMTAGFVPKFLESLVRGRGAGLDQSVVAAFIGSPAYCEGYLPSCSRFHRVTLGAYLSVLCHDLQPFVGAADGPDVLAEIGGAAAFEHGPYNGICSSWPIAPAAGPLTHTIHSNVPTWVIIGDLDPFVSAERLTRALAPMTRLTVLHVPNWGHNALGSGSCAGSLRNAWVNSLAQSTDTQCLEHAPPMTFQQ